MKVLCYSPHNRWVVHGHWDMTIAHGLRNRGAEVRYVMCDGLFSDCDVYWKAWEEFLLAESRVDNGVPEGDTEDDLFAGVRADVLQPRA